MIHYQVRCDNSHRHFIAFEARFPTSGLDKIQLQLPAWRPGRYELGNFSKNIKSWKAADVQGRILSSRKLTKDLWEVECVQLDEIIVSYEYYASDLNAGSTYLDSEQLYINPVNCFFFNPNRLEDRYRVEFFLPEDYKIACGLEKESEHILVARNFDHLADCPLIASSNIRHLEYTLDKVKFHVWIQGEVRLEEARLLNEFSAFTKAQMRIFGDIPCPEYHFLFQFTPYFLRHGVEHSNSTVIAMGPSADFQTDALFKDLLGISCHELFHTWNVKSIRPIEMLPYDFTKENYSRLGYVYEGVTTYYGDLLLWRSGAISDLEWFQAVEERLQDHFENHGRHNLSVADSSFDTWLDGYSSGIPWRKVSIYNEGFLIALICDILIIQSTGCKASLDDVMRIMYERFGKLQRGYSGAEYQQIVADVSARDITDVFDQLVNGTSDFSKFLLECFGFLGLNLGLNPSNKWSEAFLGLVVEESNQRIVVLSVYPDSPADKAGLWAGDEIVALNGTIAYKNFQLMLRMKDGPIEMDIIRKGRQGSVKLAADGNTWAKKYRLLRSEQPSNAQLEVYDNWKFRY